MNQSNRKILAVSGTPTHPRTAGNRAKLYSLLKTLQDNGYEIHFLYLTQEHYYDEEGMKHCWDKFYKIDYQQPQGSPRRGRFFELSKKIIFKLFKKRIVTPFKIDDWYEPAVGEYVRQLTQTDTFVAVILLYVFHSKVLETVNSGSLKILEAQDVFSNRHKLYLKLGMEPTFFYTTKQEEARGLNRADVILAIQDKEKIFYESLCAKPVLTIGHQVVIRYLHIPRQSDEAYRLLYVGSENPVNVEGMRYFLNQILPEIKKRIPSVTLFIAGRICHHLPNNIQGTVLLGEVPDVEQHYAAAHLVVNPIREGTGLKIKTIEAMGYGKPLVTTPHGASGLEDAAGKAFLLAKSTEEFVHHIHQLYISPQNAENLAKEAYAYAQQYNMRYLSPLLEIMKQNTKQ